MKAGTNTNGEPAGIFFSRKDSQEWSLPISVLLSEGDISFRQGPYEMGEKADILILLNDQNAVDAFLNFGQVGFNSTDHRVVPGPVVGGRDEDIIRFVTELSSNPDSVGSLSFAYSLCDGKVQGCELLNPVFQVRESSNQKYYENKNATLYNINKNFASPKDSRLREVLLVHQALSSFLCKNRSIAIKSPNDEMKENTRSMNLTRAPLPVRPMKNTGTCARDTKFMMNGSSITRANSFDF